MQDTVLLDFETEWAELKEGDGLGFVTPALAMDGVRLRPTGLHPGPRQAATGAWA